MSVIAQNYAKGLLEAAGSAAGEVATALEEFQKVFESSDELRAFIVNPVVPLEAKKGTVRQLLPENAPSVVMNFLCLLIDKRRFEFLNDIIIDFNLMKAKQDDILIIMATSAQPLTQQQQDELTSLYCKKYGKDKASLVNVVDPSLIGGLRIQVGDILTDDSVSGRLRALATAISQ